ncbi:unnamed protein product [Gulo gulo]|uniref:Uncharacterized protein n=1 Tax=Gulo gulo TaxID=48420 RepID=A0A9X9PVY2_GULGU|nr:unnamed protein product [Gulo gulo]
MLRKKLAFRSCLKFNLGKKRILISQPQKSKPQAIHSLWCYLYHQAI